MTDFNTWNEEVIAAVQKHLNTSSDVGDDGEFQYIIDALDSLTDDEVKAGFRTLPLETVREIPGLLRAGNYVDAATYLGKGYSGRLPQEGMFWYEAYDAVLTKSREDE